MLAILKTMVHITMRTYNEMYRWALVLRVADPSGERERESLIELAPLARTPGAPDGNPARASGCKTLA